MARRPGGPRTRYIAFRVEAADPPDRKTLIQTITQEGRREQPSFEQTTGAWLTRYDGTHGIVRCQHTHQDAVRHTLERVRETPDGAGLRLVPLSTSGTLRTLIERDVPMLKEARDTQHGAARARPDDAARSRTPRRPPPR